MSEVRPALSPLRAAIDALDPAVLARRQSEKWSEFEPDVLAAWVAEMDFPLAEPVRAVLQTALDLDDLGYPLAPRETGIREAFAERMATRFDWAIDPARVEAMSDVVQGLFISLDAFTPEGAGVVTQTPIYPPFLKATRDAGRPLHERPWVRTATGYEVDFDALEDAFAQGARTLLLCNPHNPTGRVYRQDELERIAGIVLAHDGIVVADEIHADLVYAPHRHLPIARISPEIAARTITLNSASKAFNLPGLRCAVAHFGTVELQRAFVGHVPRRVRGGLGLLGLQATVAAWREGDAWLDEIVEVLDENRRHLASLLDTHFPEIVHRVPEGTYMTWIDCDALAVEGSPARHFRDAGRVALTEGRPFGRGFERHARINFATSRRILDEIVERMQKAMRR